MRCVLMQRSRSSQASNGWGPFERLPELLRQSDYVFLCVPLSAETRGFIDEAAFGLMRRDACLINAARVGLVDYHALLRALSEGHLMGARLDVFDQEPIDPSSPLLSRSDAIATAHIGGVTDSSYRSIADAPTSSAGWKLVSRSTTASTSTRSAVHHRIPLDRGLVRTISAFHKVLAPWLGGPGCR